MSVGSYGLPEKRLEVPPYKLLYEFDEQEKELLEKILKEPKVEFNCELNDDGDYQRPNPDGSITRISQCPTINGIRWHLTPGKNLIPKTFYDFLIKCPEQRRLMPGPEPNTFKDITHMLGGY